jgi:hypothetical protein
MMPRDGDEETPQSDARDVIIRVGDVEVGRVNVRTLKGKAQFALEDAVQSATPATRLLAWLQTYAGLDAADVPRVRDELGELEAWRIVALLIEIQEAIGKAMQLPNDFRRRSRTR